MPPAAPEPEAWAKASACRTPGAGEGGDEVLQARVQLRDLGCGGALLRAEYGGGAGRPEQRAGDVAGDDDLDPVEIDGVVGVDAVDAGQVLAGRGSELAGAVEEAVAQRGEHSDAAVGAGAAAEGEYQAVAGQV